MKLTRTLVFIVLFIVAMAVYLFQAHINQQALKIVPDEVNRKVTISKTDRVTGIELRDPVRKTKIVLQNQNGAWMIQEPLRYPAEAPILDGFVALARMASQQPRLRAEKGWDEYGLAKPESEILFDLQGKKTATLLIGAPTPVGKAVFARWAEERGFLLLPVEAKGMFRQSVYGLRQKRLFRMPVENIRKIYVDMGKFNCEWIKDGDQWYWIEPLEKMGQKIDPNGMNIILEGLQSFHAREFLDANKKSKAELGFFMIHDCIWIESEDGKREAFYFGDEVPEQNAYYGLLEGENVIFFVDRVNVVGFFDYLRKIQAVAPKLETKDLNLKAVHG